MPEPEQNKPDPKPRTNQQKRIVALVASGKEFKTQRELMKAAGYSDGMAEQPSTVLRNPAVSKAIEKEIAKRTGKSRALRDLSSATIENELRRKDPDPVYALQTYTVTSKLAQDEPEPDDDANQQYLVCYRARLTSLARHLRYALRSPLRAQSLLEQVERELDTWAV
jgi:hypothetical protein